MKRQEAGTPKTSSPAPPQLLWSVAKEFKIQVPIAGRTLRRLEDHLVGSTSRAYKKGQPGHWRSGQKASDQGPGQGGRWLEYTSIYSGGQLETRWCVPTHGFKEVGWPLMNLGV